MSETKGKIQAEAFINAMYGNIKQGFLSLWTLEDKKTRWYSVNDQEQLIQDAMKLRDSYNVYFGVGARKENLGEFKRGKNEDISALPGVWVEIDLKDGVHAASNLPDQEEVQGILDTFPLEPSIINHSGGGLHCYWLFDAPAQIRDVKNMLSAERMLSRFQNVFIRLARTKGLHIDNTADLARVLRVPGTFNNKAEPKPVTTQLFEPDRRYNLMELLEAIESIEATLPEEIATKAPRKQYEGEIPDAKHSDRIVQECQFIRDYMEHKETANYSEWVSALTIAAYCEDGENLVHEWSEGHNGYNEQATDRKYEEIRSKMKPRTCQSLQQEFGKCSGCRHFNKINSPISLGMEKKKPMQKPKKEFMRTDLGNAERLIHRHGENIKFNTTFNQWFLWDGKRWKVDKLNQIQLLAKDTVRNIYNEAAQEEDAERRQSLSKHAVGSESRSRIEAMISLARSEVPFSPEQMDQDQWLLNCENGMIDLRSGKLLPHDRDKLITKLSPIEFNPKAECPTWIKFLESIMQDDEGNVKYELVNYIQRLVGYSLTGDTSEQKAFFFYGTGRNGKSTFVNVVKEMLGDYGKQTNAETFTVKKNDRVNNDIAALQGSRFVAATESEENARLAESLLKQLTGGEPISARFLHQEYFEYIPNFKICFTTNHKPVIKGGDLGIWRRIDLVPFTRTIPEDQIDKHLPEKLRAEMPGILAWAVEGCLKWQREGLNSPKEVQEATANYRNEMDIIGNFLSECCILNEKARALGTEIYGKYSEWCDENGEYALTKTKFNKKLEERGLKKGRDGKGIHFQGIGIRDLSLSSNSHYEQNEHYEEKYPKVSYIANKEKKAQNDSFSSLLHKEDEKALKETVEYL